MYSEQKSGGKEQKLSSQCMIFMNFLRFCCELAHIAKSIVGEQNAMVSYEISRMDSAETAGIL